MIIDDLAVENIDSESLEKMFLSDKPDANVSENDKVEVSAVDPVSSMQAITNDKLAGIAGVLALLSGLFLWIITSSFYSFIVAIFVFLFCVTY